VHDNHSKQGLVARETRALTPAVVLFDVLCKLTGMSCTRWFDQRGICAGIYKETRVSWFTVAFMVVGPV